MATVEEKRRAVEQENPLVEGLERLPVHPTTLVIFGATGDLALRKLFPAVYNLAHDGSLPERFNLIGVARRDLGDEVFRKTLSDSIERFSRRRSDPQVLDALLRQGRYVQGTFDDPDAYERLGRAADTFEEEAGVRFNRVFYLATAPEFFPVIVTALGAGGLQSREGSAVRVVIEKPFGHDLESARALNRTVREVFDERQVYRIDHYLGKETVQNLLAFRFANAMFEPVWNRNYIDSVQITAAEDIGIGTRAEYYDSSGALRDLVQNHMLQLMTLLCMEPPSAFSADKLRDEKVKVAQAIKIPTEDEVPHMAVRAQYGPGVSRGDPVPGYLDEDGVPDTSTTETFAALRLEVSNWRWAGVPFYLRTGKRLARRITEIAVILKPVPHLAFDQGGSLGVQPNQLVLTVQPDEGVSLSLGAKIPGPRMRIRPVNMEFHYGTSFLSESPEAYERLILDAMRGDASLFTREDEVRAFWGICDPILRAWSATPGPLPTYAAGSAGPREADSLLLEGSPAWRAI
jgi:glucose-6-phosphate 1-dehydrogenase